jgi:hypothetical protein
VTSNSFSPGDIPIGVYLLLFETIAGFVLLGIFFARLGAMSTWQVAFTPQINEFDPTSRWSQFFSSKMEQYARSAGRQ